MQIIIRHNSMIGTRYSYDRKTKKGENRQEFKKLVRPKNTNRDEIPQKWRPVLTEIGRQLRVSKLLAETFRPESADKFLHGEQKLL